MAVTYLKQTTQTLTTVESIKCHYKIKNEIFFSIFTNMYNICYRHHYDY